MLRVVASSKTWTRMPKGAAGPGMSTGSHGHGLLPTKYIETIARRDPMRVSLAAMLQV
jgi:hypothetical protein